MINIVPGRRETQYDQPSPMPDGREAMPAAGRTVTATIQAAATVMAAPSIMQRAIRDKEFRIGKRWGMLTDSNKWHLKSEISDQLPDIFRQPSLA